MKWIIWLTAYIVLVVAIYKLAWHFIPKYNPHIQIPTEDPFQKVDSSGLEIMGAF